MIPSLIEPATFRLVAQCLNQKSHRVAQIIFGEERKSSSWSVCPSFCHTLHFRANWSLSLSPPPPLSLSATVPRTPSYTFLTLCEGSTFPSLEYMEFCYLCSGSRPFRTVTETRAVLNKILQYVCQTPRENIVLVPQLTHILPSFQVFISDHLITGTCRRLIWVGASIERYGITESVRYRWAVCGSSQETYLQYIHSNLRTSWCDYTTGMYDLIYGSSRLKWSRRSKVWVWGRPIAGIVGSSLAGSMHDFLLWVSDVVR